MRRFTKTPYYTGPDDPDRGQIRGTLALGETVIIETPVQRDGDLRPGVIPELEPPRGSRHGGPFLIEGIMPGDWVAIHLLAIEVGAYGYVNNGGPFRGHLRSVVAIEDGMVHFPPDLSVPIKPMIGVIQLESVQQHPCPWNHGGNLDYNSICAGSIVYIRAQRPGGYLFIDDAHARMGDGELTGTGVEVDAAVTLKVERAPGFPTGGPVVESAEAYYTSGMGATWEDALRIAWTDMVALVCHLYGTSAEHANLLVGTLGDAVPGFVAYPLYARNFRNDGLYVTCQIRLTKELQRRGRPRSS